MFHHKSLLLITVTLLIIIFFPLLTNQFAYSATNSLHIDGRYVKDAYGNVIVLKGVNFPRFIDSTFGDWLKPEGGVVWTTYTEAYVSSTLDAIKDYGGNCIRVLFTIEFWVRNTDGFRERIQNFVSLAAERGIYVVFVPWRVSVVGGYTPNMPYPPNNVVGDTEIINSQDAFVNFWNSVALTLKGYSNVLFELWNEPHSDKSTWFSVVQKCITSIRSTGAENIIVVQWDYTIQIDYLHYTMGSIWTLDWIKEYPLTDSSNNILYSTHIYRAGFYNWNNTSGKAYLLSDMEWALEKLGLYSTNKAVWIGEVGASRWESDQTGEIEFFRNTLSLLNQRGIGFAVWDFWVTGDAFATLTGNAGYELNNAGEVMNVKLLESSNTEISVSSPSPSPITSQSPSSTVNGGSGLGNNGESSPSPTNSPNIINSGAITIDGNSTISNVQYQNIGSLSFTVSGIDGTTGFTYVSLPKTIVAEVNSLRAYVDGISTSAQIFDNGAYWKIHISYNHSVHFIELRFSPNLSEQPSQTTIFLSAMATIVIIAMLITRKNKRK